MKRSKAKKKAAPKKATKKATKRRKPKAKKKVVKKKAKKANITARAKMAGILCIKHYAMTMKPSTELLIVKRLTKEVQEAVDAGSITAISLKGMKLVGKDGTLLTVKEGRFDEFMGVATKPVAIAGATVHDEEDVDNSPRIGAGSAEPFAQAARGGQPEEF